MSMIDDDDDKTFEQALKDSENEALLNAINKLATLLSAPRDSGLADAIKGQGAKMDEFLKEVAKITKQEDKYSSKYFITLTQKISSEIISSNNKVIEAIENRLLPDSFELKKSSFGVTESVKVNYKQASKIK